MPTRVYQLAKELKVEINELLEICARAGIQGKGSALANLSDDEVAKVKAYREKQLAPPKPPQAGPAAPPESPGAPGTVSAVPSSTSSSAQVSPTTAPAPAPTAAVAAPFPGPTEFDFATTLVKPASKIKVIGGKSKAKAATSGSTESKDTAAVPQTAPSSSEQVSAGEASDAGAETKPEAKPKKTREKKVRPVIHVAKLPDVAQPTPVAPPEPEAQKPELRLPKDAILKAKGGERGPLKDLRTKLEQEQEKDKQEIDKAQGSVKSVKEKGRPSEPKREGEDLAAHVKKATKTHRPRRDVEVDEMDRSLAGMSEARADRQKARRQRLLDVHALDELEPEETARPLRRQLQRRKGTSTAAPRKGKIAVELPCTVRKFSEATGVSSSKVLTTLLKFGLQLHINAPLEPDLVELVAAELGLDVEIKQPELPEERILREIRERKDDPSQLVPRPPVVTFLGHVDHGKTSMLDYLIGTNVAAKEAGGITQHIRAYQVRTRDGRYVSFVDTPGHEAFTELRARGANVTDIAVIVIAADDGIMPQTEEAISHAQAAQVPIVVAINKIDLPTANPQRILTQLTEHGLTPSEWGGDVEVVRTSAITGEGMDTLLDVLLTVAELHDYRANPNRPAYGVCLESEQAGTRGVVAKLIVQNGTLHVGDVVVCGTAHGRVKAMFDTLNPQVRVEEAFAARPVNVIGFDHPPEAGQLFFVVDDISTAREIAERRAQASRAEELAGTTARVSFEKFQEMLRSGQLRAEPQVVTLNLILRADTRGSIDAIMNELGKLQHPEVRIRVLLKGVGAITAGDVHLAEASDAVIVGFNVTPDERARELAEQKRVEIRRYDIIYHLSEDLKALLEGKLQPQEQVVELGRAVVKQVFNISRVGNVAGCYVVQGKLERGCRVRVFREGRKIGEYTLESLRRVKEDVREVPRGFECGVRLANFDDVKPDDILEAFRIEEVARKL